MRAQPIPPLLDEWVVLSSLDPSQLREYTLPTSGKHDSSGAY